jgi:hypothetical protein
MLWRTDMEQKKVIYISAPTVEGYGEELARYVDAVNDLGYIALTTSRLPQGLTTEQDQLVRCGMIAAADAVLYLPRDTYGEFLPGDYGLALDRGKPIIFPPTGRDVKPYWLREALEEVSA